MSYSIILIQYYKKIVQLQMTDNPKCNTKQNIFSLIRLKPECKIIPTFVDFSPPFISSGSNGSILPVFNHDRCHFTPAFLLSSEKKTQAKRKQSEKMEFEHRIRWSTQSLSSEKVTGLTPSSNYCQICQELFKKYEQHVQLKTHMLRWHHNQFNEDIQQLCYLVEDSQRISTPSNKRKMIKKRDFETNSVKSSPKTTVDNYAKRKMSISYQEASFTGSQIKPCFKL